MEGRCRVFDDSLWCSNSPSPSFHENCEELDEHFHQPEKKRRLRPDQVEFLEKSFEVDNKLEPDRKAQLAKEVGLQPRQVAIWFQNRRARFKTKLLEKEYGSLKSSYDKLKADYDALCTDNQKLKNEVTLLNQKLGLKESVNLKPKPEPRDVFDSDSPHYTDGNHSAVLDPSDFSQDEDDSFMKKSRFPTQKDDKSCLPKLEEEWYDDLQPNSCNFGFPVHDQGTWFWQY